MGYSYGGIVDRARRAGLINRVADGARDKPPPPQAGEASYLDRSREVEALAELIGQMQHAVELLEAAFGRNPYSPLVVDLHIGTSQTINLPVEAHQIEQLQVSGDTTVTAKVYLLNSQTRGQNAGLGQLIGQIFMPANAPVAPLQLNAPVPPGPDNQLTITTSAAVANGSAVITLARTRPGSSTYHAG